MYAQIKYLNWACCITKWGSNHLHCLTASYAHSLEVERGNEHGYRVRDLLHWCRSQCQLREPAFRQEKWHSTALHTRASWILSATSACEHPTPVSKRMLPLCTSLLQFPLPIKMSAPPEAHLPPSLAQTKTSWRVPSFFSQTTPLTPSPWQSSPQNWRQ